MIAELARGGMGVVYLGTSSGVGGFTKLHVVKELKPELVDDPGFVEMFLEEARLAARLNHPNIVPTNEVGIDGTRPFLVMEYLDGQTLARALRKKPAPFTLPMHVRVIAQTLEGLHYAHTQEDFDGTRRGVVHRDVSPQNVFVTYDGQVKILDFGIAKAADSTVETRTGVFKGKPAYMSPEQLRGVVDPRGDVFAAGVMLWEAMAGRRMWDRRTDVEILTALLRGDLPSIDEAAPLAPEALRAIVKRAIAVDIEERYDSANAMRVALDGYLETTGDRTTQRQIGEVLTAGFAERRLEIRSVIEGCINAARVPSAETTSALFNIAPTMDEPSAPSRSRSIPSLLAFERGVPASRLGQVSNSPPSREPPPPSSMLTPAADVRLLAPPSRSRRGLVIAGALVVLLILGGAMFLAGEVAALKRDEASRPVATAPAEALPSVTAVTTGAAAPSVVVPSAHPDGDAEAAPASASKPAPPPRIIYLPAPARTAAPAPRPVPTTAPPSPLPTAAAASPPDCNPPFYFDGTKKVFKPGCL